MFCSVDVKSVLSILAVDKADIDSFVPIAEVVTCSGFFLVSFLEELVHHFIHPHNEDRKLQSKRQNRQPLGHQQEFELYDAKRRNIQVNNQQQQQDHNDANTSRCSILKKKLIDFQ